MAKLTNSQAALTHAKAYVYDRARSHYEDEAEAINEALDQINTARELKEYMTTGRVGEYYISHMYSYWPVMDFYKAMVKVVPTLKDTGSPEHTGTEDRGWWRVFGAIRMRDGYFCEMDLGRDQWMAETFYKVGAITAEEYAAYKTSMTLNMMGKQRFQTNNFPDVTKILGYWKKDYQEQVLDMRLIRMLEVA